MNTSTHTSSPVILSEVHRLACEPMHGVEGPMYLVPTKSFFVYILSNRSKTLYIGVTNNLRRRVAEYKQGVGSGFATKYKLDRLVYYERYEDVLRAIDREKQLKRWVRRKKIALIVALNPTWKDLSAGWYDRHLYEPEVHRSHSTPSLRSVAQGRLFDSAEPFASE